MITLFVVCEFNYYLSSQMGSLFLHLILSLYYYASVLYNIQRIFKRLLYVLRMGIERRGEGIDAESGCACCKLCAEGMASVQGS